MNASKKTMFAAALAVAIIALAGVGYASYATSYKAVTVNDDNDAEVAYVKATQTDYTGVFNGNADFNTYSFGVDTNETIVYTLVGGEEIGTTGHYGKSLGSTTITLANTTNISDYTKYTISASAGTLDLPGNEWKLMISYSTGTVNELGNSVVVVPTSGKVTAELYLVSDKIFSDSADNKVTSGLPSSLEGYTNLASSLTAPNESGVALYENISITFSIVAEPSS